LTKYQLPKNMFPMRAKIPLFFFMEATFHFENLVFTSKRRLDLSQGYNSKFPMIELDPYTFQIDQKIE